jgi:large subunit ribosomal protein L32
MVVHMRHTRAHTANRRSHHALKGARFVACKECGAKHLMHRVCMQCGKYRGRLVVDVLKKTVKATKKAEAKKEAKKGEEKKEVAKK